MPYTPPAGNAVNFNFSGVYSPPAGGSVTFNFGAVPLPPVAQLPTGKAQTLREEDWFFLGQRRVSNIIATASGPVPLKMQSPFTNPREDDDWTPPSPRRFNFVAAAAATQTFASISIIW